MQTLPPKKLTALNLKIICVSDFEGKTGIPFLDLVGQKDIVFVLMLHPQGNCLEKVLLKYITSKEPVTHKNNTFDKKIQSTYFAIHLKCTKEKDNIQGEKLFHNRKCLQKKKETSTLETDNLFKGHA